MMVSSRFWRRVSAGTSECISAVPWKSSHKYERDRCVPECPQEQRDGVSGVSDGARSWGAFMVALLPGSSRV
nr:hypothetical protein [uncultured Methanoregula sp.]